MPWHADKSCAEFKASLENERLLGDKKLVEFASLKNGNAGNVGGLLSSARVVFT